MTSTPELPFFETYEHSPEYDAEHALEHELIRGELHINRNRNHPDVELFIIDPKNKHSRSQNTGRVRPLTVQYMNKTLVFEPFTVVNDKLFCRIKFLFK